MEEAGRMDFWFGMQVRAAGKLSGWKHPTGGRISRVGEQGSWRQERVVQGMVWPWTPRLKERGPWRGPQGNRNTWVIFRDRDQGANQGNQCEASQPAIQPRVGSRAHLWHTVLQQEKAV